MIGSTWNLRGIKIIEKQRFLRETLCEKRLDFIGLQETLKDDFKAQDLAKFDSAKNFIWNWSAPRGRLGCI
jgi:exonuclease III